VEENWISARKLPRVDIVAYVLCEPLGKPPFVTRAVYYISDNEWWNPVTEEQIPNVTHYQFIDTVTTKDDEGD
jgi:hypothetical protein